MVHKHTQHSMQSMCRASSIPEADVCAVLLSQDVASEQPRNVAVKAVRSCLSFVLVWAVSSKTLSLSSAFSESEWNQVWMSDVPKNGSVGASSRCAGAAVSAYPVLHCNNSPFVARTRWISISRRFILAELLRCSRSQVRVILPTWSQLWGVHLVSRLSWILECIGSTHLQGKELRDHG